MKNPVVVEATPVFQLVFGSSDCSQDLDLEFSLEEPYSLLGQEKESSLETGLETAEASHCRKARAYDWAAVSEIWEEAAEARLVRADFDDFHEGD